MFLSPSPCVLGHDRISGWFSTFYSLNQTQPLLVYRQIKLHCAEPFNQYWNCLDESNVLQFRYCRKQQQLFDDCVLDKLGWVRPELGQLSKVSEDPPCLFRAGAHGQ